MTYHQLSLNFEAKLLRAAVSTALYAVVGPCGVCASKDTKPTRAEDKCSSDVRLNQYYTCNDVAKRLYAIFCEHIDPTAVRIVEPSAGEGAFFKMLPPGSLGFDVDPKCPGMVTADFLHVEICADLPVAVLGNPPFGKNASMAVRFFNHAAHQSDLIAFIMPRSVRKAAIENRLNSDFHLLREEDVPESAFLFRGKPFDVPAVFQIWERRSHPRLLKPVATKHPDFEFTSPDRADFAIQRVGARAGRVHRDFKASPNSHYFIRGKVESVMRELDFTTVTGDVAGNPSLAKSEIIRLYLAWSDENLDRTAG